MYVLLSVEYIDNSEQNGYTCYEKSKYYVFRGIRRVKN